MQGFLYFIAEEGRKDDGGSYKEKACSDEDADGFRDALLSYIHLIVNLKGSNDSYDRCNSIKDVQDIEHHGDYIVMHRGQGISSPAVVHATTSREGSADRKGKEQQYKKVASVTNGSHTILKLWSELAADPGPLLNHVSDIIDFGIT